MGEPDSIENVAHFREHCGGTAIRCVYVQPGAVPVGDVRDGRDWLDGAGRSGAYRSYNAAGEFARRDVGFNGFEQLVRTHAELVIDGNPADVFLAEAEGNRCFFSG